ncbi:MFS transporter [Oryzobacter telluris]|uniref:MFS transporter n=1 Tax=Oryzobacter telluris TaxID=3149179 RepID=UPI00370DB42D
MTLPSIASATRTRPSEYTVLAVTAAAVFMSFLDVTIVNIAFGSIRADFGTASLSLVSWVVNGYGVAFAAALLPAGALSDRLGHRTVFVAGVALFGAASLVAGLSGSVAVLIAARVAQALGAAALVPSAQAALLTATPVHHRGRALAVLGSTGAVAAAAGPALGGVLIGSVGWPAVFLVNVPVAVVVAIAARRLLPRPTPSRAAGAGDGTLTTLAAVGVAAVALALVQAPDWGLTDPRTAGSLVAGLLLVGVLVLRARRHASDGALVPLFALRSFRVANLGSFVFATAFYPLLLANALFLTTELDYDITTAGIALTPGALMAALTAVIGGRAVDRAGARSVAVTGGVLLAAGCTVLALRAPGGVYVTDILGGVLLTGTGIGLSLTALTTAAVSEVPAPRFGVASATTACLRQIGGVLGIAALIAMLAGLGPRPATYSLAWGAMAVSAVLAAACGAALAHRTPSPVTTSTRERAAT